MIEGKAKEIPERDLFEAIRYAEPQAEKINEALEKMSREKGIPKRETEPFRGDPELREKVRELAHDKLKLALHATGKKMRHRETDRIYRETLETTAAIFPDREGEAASALEDLKHEIIRRGIMEEGKRIDGRKTDEVRPISAAAGWLPRAHGSALFSRGETQAIVTCTLGSGENEQQVETLEGVEWRNFLLHYNFPPYSVGEARPMRGPGRREIGHGTLALKALAAVLPPHDDFPYTIRVVSDISQSDGSSSMATVCGGSLALMDAGVPVEAAVAGVAMGLVKEGDRFEILTDILGEEDHQGDMDFKVAGTSRGITAFQLDNKLGTLPCDILEKALERARAARVHVLSEMAKTIEKPRDALSPHAPRVELLRIRKERIKDLIGPGGRVIQDIQAATSTKIDVGEEGEVKVFSPDEINMRAALKRIKDLILEPLEGKFYRGVVTGVKDFGVFVRISGAAEGLVHVLDMASRRIGHPSELVKEGDEVAILVSGVDKQGRLQFSMRDAEGIGPSQLEN